MNGSLIPKNLIYVVMHVSLGGFISHFSLMDDGAAMLAQALIGSLQRSVEGFASTNSLFKHIISLRGW